MAFLTYYTVLQCLFLCHVVSAKPPHILFILADDYGYNDVGYHGSEIKTPNLNELANDGVRLENYYVQPLSAPTRSQLMSGRYQIHTGLQHGNIPNAQPSGLPLDITTLADKLRDRGYTTHAVGKWHLGFFRKEYLPLHRGFDTHYGFLTDKEDHFNHKSCDQKGPGLPDICGTDFRDGFEPVNLTGIYSTDLYRLKVLDILVKHDPEKPIFLYLAFQAPHAPLQVPEEYLKQVFYIGDIYRKKYAGMVVAMDSAIGEIVEALKDKGMWNNTLTVFSTDNGGLVKQGGGNNWPLRGYKGSLWEGGVRGVAFVHGNVLGRSKVISNELMHVSDWYPTLVGLAGSSVIDPQLDGMDQWQSLSEGTASPRDHLLHNIDPLTPPIGERVYNDTFDTRVRAALRWKDWKVITGNPGNGSWVYAATGAFETVRGSGGEPRKNLWLFNIAKDPNEMDDLSDVFPDITRQMLRLLDQINQTAVPCVYPELDPNADPALHGGFWGPWL